jgi:hypothetical protein
VNELSELAEGRWDRFHGLRECGLADADAQFGPPVDDELIGGRFGGEPAEFRLYPPTKAAPMGITCWLLDDVVVGVEIPEPLPIPSSLEALGKPDLVLESGLGSAWAQEVWASRGLVIHRRGKRIRVAFGLAPIDPDEWLNDPLRWWRIERRPTGGRGSEGRRG